MSAALRFCIFCLRTEGDRTPWCPDNPGDGCTYGHGHEFPCAVCGGLLCKVHVPGQEDKPKQPRKIDKNRCLKCDLNIKNPLSPTNGCAHEYPA